MSSLDILVKLLTTPGIFWPLVMTNLAMFCAGGYASLSMKFIYNHRKMVTYEEFERHLQAFHRIEAVVELNNQSAQAGIEEVREDLGKEIEKVSDEVARKIDSMRNEIRDDMRERFDILNAKSDTIHRSLHDFKSLMTQRFLRE